MGADLWIALIGLLTALVGAVRWLIYVYWKQASTIEDLRSKNEKLAIERLNTSVDGMKESLLVHRTEMQKLRNDIEVLQTQLRTQKKDGEAIMESLSTYIETTKARIAQVETQVVQLGKALIMIKGGKGGGEGGQKN
jgi:predicted  nucleic acid-binding Zn-ribbon protein